MSRPTLSELIIAIDARTRFYLAAQDAPVGSMTESTARREYEEAMREARRVEKELGAYITGLEVAAQSVRFDKRRS